MTVSLSCTYFSTSSTSVHPQQHMKVKVCLEWLKTTATDCKLFIETPVFTMTSCNLLPIQDGSTYKMLSLVYFPGKRDYKTLVETAGMEWKETNVGHVNIAGCSLSSSYPWHIFDSSSQRMEPSILISTVSAISVETMWIEPTAMQDFKSRCLLMR